jgi:hypothetical protein
MYWILLATSWRADGTPRLDRKFLSAVENGDPLAIAILVVFLIAAVWSTIQKFRHAR